MIRTILTLTAALCGVAGASPLPPGAQLRSSNTVTAEFVNVLSLPCPRHTGRPCPDGCDRATEAVVLTVLSNDGYSKNGRYADAKIKAGEALTIDIRKPIPGQDDADVHAKLSSLHFGDKVRLTIKQYYMEIDGRPATYRPATVIEVIPFADQPPTQD